MTLSSKRDTCINQAQEVKKKELITQSIIKLITNNTYNSYNNKQECKNIKICWWDLQSDKYQTLYCSNKSTRILCLLFKSKIIYHRLPKQSIHNSIMMIWIFVLLIWIACQKTSGQMPMNSKDLLEMMVLRDLKLCPNSH
jgi:hypothetical protein